MLIACPSCHSQLNVPDHAAGKQVRCPAPNCGTVFTVATLPLPATQPAAEPPAAAGDAPFEFGGGVAGPEADFAFTAQDDGGLPGIGVRNRLNRASGWLNTAAGSMVLWVLFNIAMMSAVVILTRGDAWHMLVGALCAPFILLPFPITIVVGARMLARRTRWGLALTGAILCLVVGVVATLGVLGALIASVAVLGKGIPGAPSGGPDSVRLIFSCLNPLLLVVVAFCSTFAGIIALRTLTKAEIKQLFA